MGYHNRIFPTAAISMAGNITLGLNNTYLKTTIKLMNKRMIGIGQHRITAQLMQTSKFSSQFTMILVTELFFCVSFEISVLGYRDIRGIQENEVSRFRIFTQHILVIAANDRRALKYF
ncbi:hypothetical protein BAAA27672_05900 [Bifidobacterium animalis subsp. animalis ATCC 27672]|nr:hypothetical protein BAAA27672_05900 [Bifidobacterium animalis subsp. animalis ATCC 27672]